MDIGKFPQNIKSYFAKYKFILVILLVGIGLMLLPDMDAKKTTTVEKEESQRTIPLEQSLSNLLCKVKGAGKVEVMLNIAQGEEVIYQVDADITDGSSGYTSREETITLTDGERNQFGLVQQINPPVYLGALVLCQGADDPVVKLSIVEAVSKITGLNANQVCVIKMN